MNPIQPSSSPRACVANAIANNNEAHELQGQPPIADNPGNLVLNASPRGQARAVQLSIQNEGGALKIDKNFLKALMSLPKEMQSAIFSHIHPLEDCQRIFRGLEEGVKIIEASAMDVSDKEAEIKKLKDLLDTLLQASSTELLDLSGIKAIECLAAMAIFLGQRIKFEQVAELLIDSRFIGLLGTLLELEGKKAYIYNLLNKLPDMSPLAGCKAIYMQMPENLSSIKLESLSGLEACSSLTELRLNKCSALKDLSPVAGLVNLTHLVLDDCECLTDISSLANLKNLTELRLNKCNALKDLSPLAGLVNLSRLILINCKRLTDISSLANLKSLTVLRLENCNALKDLSPLADLVNLTGLILSQHGFFRPKSDGFKDVSSLARLTNLTHLQLDSCQALTDITALAHLTKLTELVLLNSEALEDLSPLTALIKLTKLLVLGSKVPTGLRPLENLTKLTELSLMYATNLTDLSPLAGLTQLRTLNLQGSSNIQNLEVLQESLPNLTITRE